jgi:uncharacterized protein YcaQ
VKISRPLARRIALAAQGFDRPRPTRPPGIRQIEALVRRLGVLQLDSVNVFSRSHYMPVFSRLGPYDRGLLDRLAGHDDHRNGRDRRLLEYWAHEASLIPIDHQPLFRWRMELLDKEAWASISRIARERPQLIAETLALVSEQGPIRASSTGIPRPPQEPGRLWNWHDGKRALEHLFYAGTVAAYERVNFERRYDLAERVIPESIFAAPTPEPADAQRELVRIAASALGVATEPDLGDYFRLPRAASKARVAELVEAGELLPATVEGWRAPAYVCPAARRPRRINARALLSPFDSLIWYRDRTERLFDFFYRIEIYTPAPKRIYGYYVLPFLLGDTLVARVDLKSDRKHGALLVQGAYAEPDVDVALVAAELATELDLVQSWLDLGRITVRNRGDLAKALAAAVTERGSDRISHARHRQSS